MTEAEKGASKATRRGVEWSITVRSQEEAREDDATYWHERLTPEERVAAVADCTLSALKTRGYRELPRLRRVCRVVDAPWR